MKRLKYILILALLCSAASKNAVAQINTEQVMRIGQNSIYLEDYVLAIQYFNKVIEAKPHLAQPYFYLSLIHI